MAPIPETDSSTACDHRLEARGYWARYVKGTTWALGYACGDCGSVKETGQMEGKPGWYGRKS